LFKDHLNCRIPVAAGGSEWLAVSPAPERLKAFIREVFASISRRAGGARAELLPGQADVAAVSKQVHLALFYDAHLDLKAIE
jgi:hypothetical protein